MCQHNVFVAIEDVQNLTEIKNHLQFLTNQFKTIWSFMKFLSSLLALALVLLSIISCNLSRKYVTKYSDLPTNNNSNYQMIENYNSSVTSSLINDDSLLKILISTENVWKQAKISGDTDTLDRIFADEFTNTIEPGHIYSKAEWLRYLSGGSPHVKTFKITDAKLTARTDDTATISFKVTTLYNYKKNSVDVLNDIDKFVFRDGRWQVTSSLSTHPTKR